jgi:hypothetical protein
VSTLVKGKNKIDPELAKKILRMVSPPETFLFFTDIGQYTGELATCLDEFLEKLNRMPLKSLEFHFERGDFEKWIRGTLGDECLADRISKIDRTLQGEEIREILQRTVKNRMDQLEVTQLASQKK